MSDEDYYRYEIVTDEEIIEQQLLVEHCSSERHDYDEFDSGEIDGH